MFVEGDGAVDEIAGAESGDALHGAGTKPRLTPQVDDERGPYAKFALPEGRAAIAIQTRDSLEEALGSPHELGGGAVVGIRVADVEVTFAEVRARGGVFLREPRDLWGRLRACYLRDPEGNLIELQQWL